MSEATAVAAPAEPEGPVGPTKLTGDLVARLTPALGELVRAELEKRTGSVAAPGGAVEERLTRLAADLQAREEALLERRKDHALAAALEAVPFFDPDDAARELRPALVEVDGAFYRRKPEAAPGQGAAALQPLSEAVRDLARRKPHWVRAACAGGTGAGGSAGSFSQPPPAAHMLTYADLLKGVASAELLRSGVRFEP